MKRVHGVVLMAVGAVLVVVGVIAAMLGGGDDASSEQVAATSEVVTTTTTTTAAPTTTITEPPPTTTTTSATTTTSTTITTTTTATTTTTTTTTAGPETVEAFVEAYAQAADADDVDFFFDRLHPVVLARTDADQCRTFIAADIVVLEDYRLNGTVAEPRAVSFDTPDGTVTVEELYEAPVSFTFRGQSFDVVAAFAPVDGQMRWLTECE